MLRARRPPVMVLARPVGQRENRVRWDERRPRPPWRLPRREVPCEKGPLPAGSCLMRSTCALLVLLLGSACLLRADGSLEAETLQSLKDATVFLKVEAGKLSASGSGFLL